MTRSHVVAMLRTSVAADASARGVPRRTPVGVVNRRPGGWIVLRFDRALFIPIQRMAWVWIYRQIVGNAWLHLFILKHYQYLDGMAADKLRKVRKLLLDVELQDKMERHISGEEKHAAFFRQRIQELGGSPTFTPAEVSLQPEVPSLVELAEIGCEQGRVGPQDGSGRLRPVPVPLHDQRAAHRHTPHVPLGIDQLHLNTRVGLADPTLQRIGCGMGDLAPADAAGLRQTIEDDITDQV